jgi:predicted nucleic acid-binding protein
MSKQKIYIETSVISYLTAKPSRDIIIAGHQQITQDWWNKARHKFDCYISQIVVEEISLGDMNAASKRMNSVKNIPDLGYNEGVENLAIQYLELFGIPEKAKLDAFHLAYAVLYNIDFLLSWNCKHIANAVVNSKLRDFNYENSLFVPFLCTPYELLEV